MSLRMMRVGIAVLTVCILVGLAGCATGTGGSGGKTPTPQGMETPPVSQGKQTPVPTVTPRPEKTPDRSESMPKPPAAGSAFGWGDMATLPERLSIARADEWLGAHTACELYTEGSTGDVVAVLSYAHSLLTLRGLGSDAAADLTAVEAYLAGAQTGELPPAVLDTVLMVDGFTAWQGAEQVTLPRGLTFTSTRAQVLAAFPQLQGQYAAEPGRLYGLAELQPGAENDWAPNVGGWDMDVNDVYLYEPMDQMDIDGVLSYVTVATGRPVAASEVRRYIDFSLFFKGETLQAVSFVYYEY